MKAGSATPSGVLTCTSFSSTDVGPPWAAVADEAKAAPTASFTTSRRDRSLDSSHLDRSSLCIASLLLVNVMESVLAAENITSLRGSLWRASRLSVDHSLRAL